MRVKLRPLEVTDFPRMRRYGHGVGRGVNASRRKMCGETDCSSKQVSAARRFGDAHVVWGVGYMARVLTRACVGFLSFCGGEYWHLVLDVSYRPAGRMGSPR